MTPTATHRYRLSLPSSVLVGEVTGVDAAYVWLVADGEMFAQPIALRAWDAFAAVGWVEDLGPIGAEGGGT